MKTVFVLAGLAMITTSAQAQSTMAPAPVCAVQAALPAAWAAWTQSEPLSASAAAAKAAPLAIGHAYVAQLVPSSQMSYVVPLYKPAPDDSFAGLFTVTVDKAGVYTIGLDGKGWIDVSDSGQVYKSVAHAEGPACTALKKTVDFQLTPGTYTVQISTAYKPTLTLEVIAKP